MNQSIRLLCTAFAFVSFVPHVDAGEGWLIFKTAEAEIGCHPADPSGEARTDAVGARRER